MTEKSFIWLRNPKGIEVEVDASRKDELLKLGYKEVGTHEVVVLRNKPKLNLSFPSQNQYPFGGYGRIVELLHECFEFTPESKNKIYCGYPIPLEKEEGQKSILITMFEADKLPKGWKDLLEQFDLIIVPSYWCQKIFTESGTTKPIEVMILGTDNFSVIQPNWFPPFKFLHYNAFSDNKRKGWDLVVKAFVEVFGRQEDMELILKGRKHDNESDIKEVPKQPNIRVVIENMKRNEVEKLQEEAQCFLFPSRGEGLGLPPIEMMARGVPTIVTSGSGMSEYAHMGIPIVLTAPVESHYDLEWEDGIAGHWIEPSLDQLKSLMWDVYSHYETYKYKAIENSTKIREKYSLDAQTIRFQEIITKYGF